jgi:molybdopterin-binding protein
MSISIRNPESFRDTIEKIVSDKVVSEVVIRTEAGIVMSIITTGSVERMNLKEGDNVFAVMKAASVSFRVWEFQLRVRARSRLRRLRGE